MQNNVLFDDKTGLPAMLSNDLECAPFAMFSFVWTLCPDPFALESKNKHLDSRGYHLWYAVEIHE